MWKQSVLLFTLLVLSLVPFSFAEELRIPVKGIKAYDGDTFYVEMPSTLMTLPPGVEINGVEATTVICPPILINVRLVDNHIRGKTRPANSPELRTPSGRAQKGAKAARDRMKQLVEDHEGCLIINTDMAHTGKSPEYNISRLLTLGRVLADFQPNDKQTTVGAIMFREKLVKDWSKH